MTNLIDPARTPLALYAEGVLGNFFARVSPDALLSPALASLPSFSERLRDVAGDAEDGTPLAYLAGLTDGSSPVPGRLARDLARKGYSVERDGLDDLISEAARRFGFESPDPENDPEAALYGLAYERGSAILTVALGGPVPGVDSEFLRVSLPYLADAAGLAEAVERAFYLATAIAGEL